MPAATQACASLPRLAHRFGARRISALIYVLARHFPELDQAPLGQGDVWKCEEKTAGRDRSDAYAAAAPLWATVATNGIPAGLDGAVVGVGCGYACRCLPGNAIAWLEGWGGGGIGRRGREYLASLLGRGC
jgi:hypothetical protein